jgi:hypothetical protein
MYGPTRHIKIGSNPASRVTPSLIRFRKARLRLVMFSGQPRNFVQASEISVCQSVVATTGTALSLRLQKKAQYMITETV